MMDWAGSIERRNYGIKRKTDRCNLIELLNMMISVLVLAGIFFFFSWVRSRIVEIGYLEQSLQTREDALLRVQKSLILEEETLKNPERIDSIARNELGMTRVRTNQLLSPQSGSMEQGGPASLAMASSPSPSIEARKPSASN